MEVIGPKSNHANSCIIFLHGFGKTGKWQKQQFMTLMRENTKFPHIKMIFPTAPSIHCSQAGKITYSWFDFKATLDRKRDGFKILPEQLEETFSYLDQLVENEIDAGISPNRIIIGGVSQGGIVSVVYGYTRKINFKGVLSLSGFYPKGFDDEFRKDGYLPPLYMANFKEDPLIEFNTAKESLDELMSKSVTVESHFYDGVQHEITEQMLKDAYKWIKNMIPE